MNVREKDQDMFLYDADDSESSKLLMSEHQSAPGRNRSPSTHLWILYIINVSLSATIVVLVRLLLLQRRDRSHDPSLGIYSPANAAVEWIENWKFRPALFNNTPYMGFPDDDIDRRWEELYNFGISKISEDEAKKMDLPTLPITGTKDYLVELDVWHELHCLNDLRKVIYPERFPEDSLDSLKFPENGTVNRDTDMFRHWDHCIDSIRQTLMCHSDVAPIPFHVNVPARKGIFPRLATTHTCRNFTKIQEWAREHAVGEWKYKFDNLEEAMEVIDAVDWDQGPGENIQELYYLFPGDQYFEYWQTHEYTGDAVGNQ